mmetsp:Transcript_10002/g.24656  ORF Transcript_10002/g.24656 Transcript_10002/m.24656 type:complete len:85 (+) Transcript_10002:21-275(+)
MSSRDRALSLFRHLYRAAAGFPTENRVAYVRRKVRVEYDIHRAEADPERVQFLLALAETQLDSVREQAAHLTTVFSDPGVHSRV